MKTKKKTRRKQRDDVLPMRVIYDALMANIEPELTSEQVDTLEEKYKGESEEERSARAERYVKAFAAFWERFDRILAEWKRRLAAAKAQVFASAEERERAGEEETLRELDSQLGTS